MSNRPGPAPLTRAQNEMITHVEAILGRHPRLQPLLQRGWTLEPGCDDDAVWVRAAGPGGEAADARLQTQRWWLPTRSGRALAIAEELVDSLEEAIPDQF